MALRSVVGERRSEREEFKKVRIYFFSFSKEESGKADWTHTYFPREEKRKKMYYSAVQN